MAARFWIGTGDGNWGSTGNWSDTSGGATGFSVPTASDDVTFDGNGNNPCTLNASARVCLSFTVDAGYTNTITHNQQLTVSGNVTLHSGYTIAGTGTLVINAASTITTGGKVWPNNFTFSSGSTRTIVGDFTSNGTLVSAGGGASGFVPINGDNIICNGVTTGNTFTGTSVIILTGGTWQGGTRIENDVILNGNVTISGSVGKQGGSLTYLSGTITTTSSTLNVAGAINIDVAPVTWNNVTMVSNGSPALNLLSNLNIDGVITSAGTGSGTFTINTSGGFTVNTNSINGNTLGFTGTAKIRLLNGTWTAGGASNSSVRNNLDIDGNATISGTVAYYDGTITYVSGTITVTGSTLNIHGACTLDTDGMSWATVTLTNTTPQTYTINSTFNANQLNIGTAATTTFAGTHGWNVNILNDPKIQVGTNTLQNSVTYQINEQFLCRSSRVGSIVLFTSNHASNKAILTLQNPAACNVLASFTRIDASNGRTIPTFNGTITDCLNIVEFHDLPTSSHAL
jgi:hypothetical protein